MVERSIIAVDQRHDPVEERGDGALGRRSAGSDGPRGAAQYDGVSNPTGSGFNGQQAGKPATGKPGNKRDLLAVWTATIPLPLRVRLVCRGPSLSFRPKPSARSFTRRSDRCHPSAAEKQARESRVRPRELCSRGLSARLNPTASTPGARVNKMGSARLCGPSPFWYRVRDLNPCYRRERAAS